MNHASTGAAQHPDFFSPRTGRRVAATQQDAIHSMPARELCAKQRMVLDAIEHAGCPLTREDIATNTNLKLSSVCGRVRELLDAGRLVVVGGRKDTATGREQQLLGIPARPAA